MKRDPIRKRQIRLPRKNASYRELSQFFDHNDGVDLFSQGITQIDLDREDLERMVIDGTRRAASRPVKA